MKNSFRKNVLNIVKGIKKGSTLTYKQVAAKAGSLGAARAVGNIMKSNFDKSVPCHRVIRSDGKIGDYNRGGPRVKREKLMKEGE